MIGQESSSETSLAQEISELGFGSSGDMGPENQPTFLAVTQRLFKDLSSIVSCEHYAESS